ncbi:MAG: hypothetical protein ACYSWU_25220, partial [Planctomycetota bacterium]
MNSKDGNVDHGDVGCPSRQQLEDYVLGKLPEASIRPLSNHVAGCVKCQAAVELLDGVSDQLIRAMRQPVDGDFSDEGPELEAILAQAESNGWASLQGQCAIEESGVNELLARVIDGREVFLGQYQL